MLCTVYQQMKRLKSLQSLQSQTSVKKYSVGAALKKSNAYKAKGVPVLEYLMKSLNEFLDFTGKQIDEFMDSFINQLPK